MEKLVTKGIICLKDDYNFEYNIADIDYIESETGDYQYLFYPHYNVIELLDSYLFQGIPGLDLSKRLKCYERKNMTPVFISERTPSENRVDLWELLDKYNMKSLNRLEWLIRTETRYSGDRFYVKRQNDINDIHYLKLNSMFDLTKRLDSLTKALLDIICYGDYLECQEISINDRNRVDYYNLLMPIYIKEYQLRRTKINNGIYIAKENNIYKGRKQISLDPLLFRTVAQEYLDGSIPLSEALYQLKISKSTFFRRLRNFDKNRM